MTRSRSLAVAALLMLPLAMSSVPATASHSADKHKKMDLLFTAPNASVNSDLAFWGDHLFIGYYTGDTPAANRRGGVRIFDISNPAAPTLVNNFLCDGLQNDPIVWDSNGNGIADLLLLAVDRTMAAPACGSARSTHDDPNGWEGVRVFTMSDDPAAPFTTITQVAAVYLDCGAHTITLWPGLVEEENKLIAYASSYPLRPGPTCGTANHANTTNPYDEDPGSPGDPLHGVIQVMEVPLGNPADAQEIAQPEITYPDDPDNQIDWCERSVTGPGEDCPIPGAIEPAARACHDIAVHVRLRLAAGACAEQGQVWTIDENGIPDTANPVFVSDDAFSSGGAGEIPGAIDFFHSATFSNNGDVVNWIDESFGAGCPPETEWRERGWHPAATQDTGRMFFVDGASGAFLSEFQVGNVRPEGNDAYCSAHMGLPVPNINRDLLVNAWYMGGVDVIDFSNPTRLREIAYYDQAPDGPTGSDNWSAYSYVGPSFLTGRGIPVYASDGVHSPNNGRGLLVFRTGVEKSGAALDHLNPQTQAE